MVQPVSGAVGSDPHVRVIASPHLDFHTPVVGADLYFRNCVTPLPPVATRGANGHQTRSADAEGIGAAAAAGSGVAAPGRAARRSGAVGRVVATIRDALEPAARAGRIARPAASNANRTPPAA